MSRTQLHKVLTHPKGGHRLGTSSATWNKIKQAAADTRHKSGDSLQARCDEDGGGCVSLGAPSGHLHLVETGPNGELCIWYEAQAAYEIWGWANVSSYCRHREVGDAVENDFVAAEKADPTTYSGDSLSLLSRFVAPGRSVAAMAFMSTNEGVVFISAYSFLGKLYTEARSGTKTQEMELPEFLQGNGIQLKASLEFLVVSSSKGLLYVLKYCPNQPKTLLVEANNDGSLQAVYSHSTRSLVEKYALKDTLDKTVLLKTGTFGGSAIHDIVGTWLVYCPKRVETEYFKNLMHSRDDSCTKRSKTSGDNAKKLYTAVKLPPNGPVLLRAASSLANTAIDNIFKLSQIGTKKMKTYWSPDTSLFDKDISLHTISTSIGNALYSTASKIKKQTEMMGENEIVKIIDLSNGHIMATFKPPGGISHLSLSQYDLQLAHATYRGDNFYIWDLCKLPKEASFVGKFLRGKTSAAIKEIFWLVNNKTVDGLQVTNSGFGCITKKTGSIHWYNINYLFCANENDNFPNTMEPLLQAVSKNGLFLDSWILPSVNAVKLLKLPGFSNVPSDMSSADIDTANLGSNLRRCNQLAFIDSTFSLRLVLPLNGKHTFKYKLNDTLSENIQTQKSATYAKWVPLSIADNTNNSSVVPQSFATPLSQTEIETCAPFSSITKDRNVAISTYNFDREDKENLFWDHFTTFGNVVPTMVHEFSGTTEYATPLTSADDLAECLNDGLLIDPGTLNEGLVASSGSEEAGS